MNLLPVSGMVSSANLADPPNAKVSYTSWRRIAVGTQDMTKVHDPQLNRDFLHLEFLSTIPWIIAGHCNQRVHL
jgi:hypothetical protein